MALRRITTETKFRIDTSWWEKRHKDYRLILWDQLCPECKEQLPTHIGTEDVDWVDPITAEVTRTDAILQCLRSMCMEKPDWIHSGLPLTTAIFRAFLIRNNAPMSARDLYELIPWRQPELILAALRAAQASLGIFPVWAIEEEEGEQAA